MVSRVRAEFAEMLNAFNRPWFVPVGLPDSNDAAARPSTASR